MSLEGGRIRFSKTINFESCSDLIESLMQKFVYNEKNESANHYFRYVKIYNSLFYLNKIPLMIPFMRETVCWVLALF